MRVNGKDVKFGDEVIYLLEQGSKVTRVPVHVINVTPKRVTIKMVSYPHHKCSVMHHRIEGFEIPVAALHPDNILDLHTLETVLLWAKNANGPEHNSYYEVMDRIEEAIKRLRK